MTSTDHKYLHAFNTISGIGTQKLRLLLAHFGTAKKAWNSNQNTYLETEFPSGLIRTLVAAHKKIDPEKEWEKLQKEDVSIIAEYDDAFPARLTKIPNPPLLLYVRGNTEILSAPSVAIVGSRKFSPYGKQVATRLAYDLAAAGVHVVSGLALGIDALAHRGALEAHSTGKTIGVLGGSIDDASIAPRTHVSLAHDILAHGGTLVSEYAPPTTPSKGTFPARNRIMAGMSDATLVIEAGRGSGTLITAQLAQDFHRPLFAVPGSIFAHASVGTNDLIATGRARIVQSVDDILNVLNIATQKASVTKSFTPQTPAEKEIFALLQKYPDGLPIDKIIRHTTLEGTTVSSTLVLMEMDSIIDDLGGGVYAIT